MRSRLTEFPCRAHPTNHRAHAHRGSLPSYDGPAGSARSDSSDGPEIGPAGFARLTSNNSIAEEEEEEDEESDGNEPTPGIAPQHTVRFPDDAEDSSDDDYPIKARRRSRIDEELCAEEMEESAEILVGDVDWLTPGEGLVVLCRLSTPINLNIDHNLSAVRVLVLVFGVDDPDHKEHTMLRHIGEGCAALLQDEDVRSYHAYLHTGLP